jgi:rod shape-determining protein MreD
VNAGVLVRWVLVGFTAIVLQASLVADLDVGGARGDVVLLLAIAAGLVGGPDRGAAVGFGAGLAFDLLLQSPFGLSALAYCIAGYVVGALQGGVLRATWWIPIASAVGGSAIGILTFALVGETVDQDGLLDLHLVTVVAVVAVLNALLVLPTARLARWAFTAGDGRRARLGLR